MQIDIQRIDKTLPLPKYETNGAAAFDLVVREDTIIQPGEIALVPGNVIIQVPEQTVLVIAPRSSLPRKRGLVFPHSIGIIDQDFHGPDDELRFQVQNITQEPIEVKRGDRLAQAMFLKLEKAEWKEVDDHGAETRGGFGSTG